MTTTVQATVREPLPARREGITHAFEAAVQARAARRACDEASRLAGALADQRAAADDAVREARRRLRAVQGLRPTRLALTVRGALGAQRAARRAAYDTALADQESVTARVRGNLEEAARWRARADQAREQAAMLPRLLDEVALLVRAVGGDGAARLAATEAAIAPLLEQDAAASAALRDARRAQSALQDAVDRLSAAHACGSDGCPRAREEEQAGLAVLAGALTEVGDAVMPVAFLTGSAHAPGGGAVPDVLAQARAVLAALASHCGALEGRRAAARHRLAEARAARTAILRGE